MGIVPPSWIPRLIIWLYVALAHLLLPHVLFDQQPHQQRAQRLTTLYGSLVAVWGLCGAVAALADVAPGVVEAASLATMALAPAIVGLLVVLQYAFTEQPVRWLWGIVGSAWAALVFAVALYARYSGNIPEAHRWMAVCGWGLLWVVLLVVWVQGEAQARWAFRRNRARYWLGATLLLAVGQALALFAARSAGLVGLMLHLGGLVAIAFAVTRRHLPNVRAMLRQILGFVLLAALTAVLILSGSLVLSPLFRAWPLQPAAIGSAAVVAVILALVYGPLRDFVVRLAERLVPHHGYDSVENLREYSLSIGNVIDLEQLATIAVETVSEVLGVERGALILVTEEGREIRLRPLKIAGDACQEEVVLDIHSPIVEHLKGRQQPLFQHDVEHDSAFQGLPPEEQEWLQCMGMEVYVPIFVHALFLGILAAGPPRSGEPFGQPEQAFLTTLAHQTAVALQNARMFDDMRELNLEIIQLNRDLRMAKERLERLDRAKTDFLAIASHELRTPLTQVKGYADVLAGLNATQTITAEQIAEITSSVVQAADRLEAVVAAMLDVSKIEVNSLDLLLAPTTLRAVMRLALQPWLKPMQLRRQHLIVEGVDDIPPIVADLQRLSQVFSNLVSNAIKSTPDGGTVAVHARQIDDTRFEVVVADTGVGIDPVDQELIFDKFFRVGELNHHSSGEFKFKGAGPGLGLPIARGVVEGHGGRIWVVSEGYDEVRCPGSAFHVVLPLQARPPAAKPSAAARTMPFTARPEGP